VNFSEVWHTVIDTWCIHVQFNELPKDNHHPCQEMEHAGPCKSPSTFLSLPSHPKNRSSPAWFKPNQNELTR
jgi:hypothetical protein